MTCSNAWNGGGSAEWTTVGGVDPGRQARATSRRSRRRMVQFKAPQAVTRLMRTAMTGSGARFIAWSCG
jgi:hypothetical protein